MQHRLAFCFVLIATLPAAAESPIANVICAPRAEMERKLTISYGSNLAATGIRDAETLMEVWTSPKGQWTLVQSYANGQACIVAMGDDWEMPQPERVEKRG